MLQTVSGTSDISVDHAFTAPGTYTAFFGVTDKDGGTTEPLGLEIEVTGSATTTTTGAAEHHHDRDRATDLDDDVHSVDDEYLVVHLARFHLDTGDERLGPAGVDRVERRADRVPRGPAAGLRCHPAGARQVEGRRPPTLILGSLPA